MDLRPLVSVVKRFKLVVSAGLVVAVLLAFFAVAKVSLNGSPHVVWRKHEQWASYSRVLVAQPGFVVGSTLVGKGTAELAQIMDEKSTAEGRLPTLATIYASFVTSDEIRAMLDRKAPMNGELQSSVLPAGPNGGGLLPIVSIAALSTSQQGALDLGNRATAALRTFVDKQQQQNGVPPEQRVQLIVLNKAGQLALLKPRSKTLPIAVFLVVAFMTVGLAFLLENLRPQPAIAIAAIPIAEAAAASVETGS